VSKHAIDRNVWSPDERDEYEDLLAEVCNATTDTRERLDLFEVKLDGAIQAHRPWASDVSDQSRRFGLGKEISRFQDRNRALVSFDGRLLSMPRVQARRVEVAGEVTYQRELIVLWSWQELLDKRAEAIRSSETYTAKVGHYDRLLALREKAPDTKTPAQAADALGIDLDEYLGQADAEGEVAA
jgi:hypothetical protein